MTILLLAMISPESPSPDQEPQLIDSTGAPLLLPSSPASSRRWPTWTTDHSLIATLTLAVISLCALVVSIYQTRVLSGQQQVMEAQQTIMIETAKAQLWPNLAMGLHVEQSYGRVTSLTLNLSNLGTGPAILEDIRVFYDGEAMRDFDHLWQTIGRPDTMRVSLGWSTISNRTIQPGEEIAFLRFNESIGLANLFMEAVNDGRSPTFYLCYRSVFGDHFQLEVKYDDGGFDVAREVDDCELPGEVVFVI